jgi:hypothetical protein
MSESRSFLHWVVMAGAVGSAGLLIRAGQRTPRFLLVIMMIWVLAPFVVIGFVDAASKRWAVVAKNALHGVMWIVVLGSLAIYGDDARGHRTAQAGFVYVVVPLVSWLPIVVALIAGLVSRKRLRQDGRGEIPK